jgi:hypothetical protein
MKACLKTPLRKMIIGSLALIAAPAAQARPVVVEMFTSLACSSCPSADSLLAILAKNPNILPLSLNITYWNNAAFSDPDALQAATDRQAWYAGLTNTQDVYTPEAVVDGTTQLVGSDSAKLTAAIATAQAAPAGDILITLTNAPMLTLKIGPGTGNATIWLFGYDSKHTNHIGGGENGGTTISEINVVKSITNLGTWTGLQIALTMSHPAGQHLAAILQTPTGAVLGAKAE